MGDGIKDVTIGWRDPGADIFELDEWDWDEAKNAFYNTLFHHEGGEVDTSKDKGGHTNYGISTQQYPDEDIANMTRERARQIYDRDFLVNARVNWGMNEFAFKMTDIGVNAGPKVANEIMQRALNTFHGIDIAEDGKVGKNRTGTTHEAYQMVLSNPENRKILMDKIIDWQQRFYAGEKLNTKQISEDRVDKFYKGWHDRSLYRGGQE